MSYFGHFPALLYDDNAIYVAVAYAENSSCYILYSSSIHVTVTYLLNLAAGAFLLDALTMSTR